MKINRKIVLATAGLVTIAAVAGIGSAAFAAAQSNGSDGAIYLYDGDAVLQEGASKTWAWNAEVFGTASATDIEATFACPVASTGVYTFISSPGGERTPTAWKAFAPNGFMPGTKDVLQVNLSPEFNINGIPGQAAIKAAGGTYSAGFACTTSNGNTVVGAFYRTITVAAGTGVWSAAANDTVVVEPPVGDPSLTGTIALQADTLAATNGVLSLVVPANAAATFNAPTLVNNKSTTTGTLGHFTVADGRVVTREGWTLSANVADFVNAADSNVTISKTQLGLVPQIVSADSAGVTAGATQVAGAATYASTFAEGAPATSVGNTVLDAALTFVAPQNKPSGTYKSTLTLTVVSK